VSKLTLADNLSTVGSSPGLHLDNLFQDLHRFLQFIYAFNVIS
jgi:hypothetical protein